MNTEGKKLIDEVNARLRRWKPSTNATRIFMNPRTEALIALNYGDGLKVSALPPVIFSRSINSLYTPVFRKVRPSY